MAFLMLRLIAIISCFEIVQQHAGKLSHTEPNGDKKKKNNYSIQYMPNYTRS